MTRDKLIETMARALAREEWPHASADARASWEHNRWPDYVREATAALTAIEAAGMRVVPVEPTEAMIQGWINEWHEGVGVIVLNDLMRRGYRSMLAAAQEDSTSE